MKEEEIVNAAEWALDHGMGTLMLQSGELLTEKRLHFVESAVRQVRALRKARDGGESDSSSSLAVALSIGELNAASYRRMVDAGASRYLLRIGEVPLFVFLFPFLVPSLFVSHRVLLSLCLSPRPPLFLSRLSHLRLLSLPLSPDTRSLFSLPPSPLSPPPQKPPTRAFSPPCTLRNSAGKPASAPSATQKKPGFSSERGSWSVSLAKGSRTWPLTWLSSRKSERT